MTSFESMRRQMVDEQIVARGVRDPRVLEAMGSVPREAFVLPGFAGHAYEDRALPIGHGQTISQPYIVALMLEALDLGDEDRVLEVGTGSGYAAAIASRIAARIQRASALKPALAPLTFQRFDLVQRGPELFDRAEVQIHRGEA